MRWNYTLAEFVREMHARVERDPVEAACAAERAGLLLRFEEIAALRDLLVSILADTRPSGPPFARRLRQMTGENCVDDYSTTHGKVAQLDALKPESIATPDTRLCVAGGRKP